MRRYAMRDQVTTAATMVCLFCLAVGVAVQWGWPFGLMVFGLLGAVVSEAVGARGDGA